MHSFSVSSAKIAINHILLKLDSLDYIFVADSIDLFSTTFVQLAPKAAEFCRITQNNGHYAVQGHSRSPISVPIESSHATFCVRIVVIFFLSRTVSEIWPIIGAVFDRWVPLFNAVVGRTPKFRIAKLVETSLYRTVWCAYFDMLNNLGMCDRDRRTVTQSGNKC